MSIVLAILEAISAIPKIKAIIDEIVALWVSKQIDNMREENILAIREVLEKHDQRKLEKAIGSKTSGEASHDAGTSIIDGVPGLRDEKTSNGGSVVK